MSLEQIKAVAKNIRKIGGGIILLTGGEPFMHPHLPEIVEAFVRQGLNVRLQTAGTHYATEDKLRACYEAGARDINVSLDSLDFRSFDYINAVPGSAKNAIVTIETISRIFRKKSAILSFGTVLSRFNYREIPAILEFARRIGWSMSLVPVHISSMDDPKGFRSFDNLFNFRREHHSELDTLAEKLIKMKKDGWPLFDSGAFIRSAVSFLKGQGPTWRKNGVCDSPNLYFAIRPNGDFTTCCDYTLERPPKTYDEDFPNLYNSGAIRREQQVVEIVKNCGGCHYGSYPEVTLSVRNPLAFSERFLATLQNRNGRLQAASVQSNFLEEVQLIHHAYTDVYPVSRWQDPAIRLAIDEFSDPKTRRAAIDRDNELRQIQNRVRGAGAEPAFSAKARLKT